jgi:sugar (pentulose or hexulose) kinase
VRVGNWSLLGGTQGGLVLRHTLDELGVAWADLAELDAAALAADPRARANGDRTPADAGRTTADEGHATTERTGTDGVRAERAGATWRAVIEAETCTAAERIATMARIVGPHHRLVVTGGWCASAAVLAAKRRLFGPLVIADVAEAGTLGAATLAARAAGALGPADALA